MDELLGASPSLFLFKTLAIFGGAAWMTGQAMALTWRTWWQIPVYAALLAATDRFLAFALFERRLLALVPFLVAWLALCAIALAAFRATRAGQMTAQYPWLFERSGPLSWRAKTRPPRPAPPRPAPPRPD